MKKSKNARALKRRKKIFKNIRQFIIVPVLVCALLYGFVFAVIMPFMSDILSIGNMFLQNDEANYSRSYENIFTPSDNSGDTVNAEDVEYPSIDKQFGTLEIKNRDVDAKLFFGDSAIALRNGVGVYAGSFIPGYGKTILVSGHNNTYFNGLKNVKKGDIVKIRTSYGNYEYKITNTKIASADDKTTYDLGAHEENLIMYTCYPFDELGLTDKRFFVYAEKVSGPAIVGIYE
ncbi:MAG: class D sortase [Ruminococcus sp.]|nr:class D sortase [Ruminococcus sp.]